MKKKIAIILIIIIIIIIIILGTSFLCYKKTTSNKGVSDNNSKNTKISIEEQEKNRVLELINKNSVGQVYLTMGVTQEDIEEVKSELETREYINNIQYISSEDALDLMREKFKNNNVLEGYNATLFPVSYSFNIKTDKFSDMTEENFDNIENDLKNIKNVDSVKVVGKRYLEIYKNYGAETLEAFINNDLETLRKIE